MGAWDALTIGRTGIDAASRGLATTTHNVVNATTVGFTRRSVQLQNADPIRRGQAWIGTGVRPGIPTRPTDGLLGTRRLREAGLAGSAETLDQTLRTLEVAFDQVTGRTPRTALDQFFESLSAATADPSDLSLRDQVVSTAQDLATELVDTSTTLSTAAADQLERLEAAIPEANAKLDEIAALNARLKGAGGALSAGDLADRRDVLLRELSESVGITAHFEPDGTATVLLGGHSLVEGDEARHLSLDSGEPPKVLVETDLGFVDATGSTSGEVGGLLEARSTTLSWLADLDAFALEFATAANTAHAAGFDANGNPGGVLFTGTTAASFQVDPAVVADSSLLAFAGAPSAAAGDGANLAALLALRDAALPSGKPPGLTLDRLTERVARDSSRATSRAESAVASLGDLDELHSNLYSVDLDEEAANLLTWQTAYQASARVISVASEMLATLLEIR